jgi:hypothetical protein
MCMRALFDHAKGIWDGNCNLRMADVGREKWETVLWWYERLICRAVLMRVGVVPDSWKNNR